MSSLSSVLAGRVMAADTKAPSRLLSCSTALKASTMLLFTPPAASRLSSKLPCSDTPTHSRYKDLIWRVVRERQATKREGSGEGKATAATVVD